MLRTSPRHILAQILVNKIRAFHRDESGALIIFTLVLFMLMVMMGGVAVDVMRHEAMRTKLQNTLDRCVLMAASLDQRLVPETVLRDCVAKTGLTDQLADVRVVDALNRREVAAIGVAPTNPYFLHLIGINEFDAKGRSTATQAINNVEISLALDVSGSMSGTKIAELKVAAQQFVDTVTAGDEHKRVSISLVPYNAQVNLGADLMNQYNVQNRHSAAGSNCLELPQASYASTAMPKETALRQMAHADYAYNTNYAWGYVSPTDATYARPNFNATFCRTTSVNQVRLPSTNAETLKAQIRALEAGGNTSILMGMKWGVTLLDPQTRPVFQDLAAQNKMASELAVRPFAYNDNDTKKIVVLMTDGEHVSHTLITDAYKTGPSGIYKASDGRYSVYKADRVGTNKYWVPHSQSWASSAYRPSRGSVTQQDWSAIWADLKVAYVAWQFYALPASNLGQDANTAFYAAFNAMVQSNPNRAGLNASLQQTCAAVKDQNVVVYGVAFQAPTNGQAQIRSCATSEAHYFDGDIGSAFSAIASDITKLRLTQ